MAYTEKKIEDLSKDDAGHIVLELILRTFDSGKEIYYHRSRINKPELANKQRRLSGSLRTNDYDKAKQLAYKRHAEIELR